MAWLVNKLIKSILKENYLTLNHLWILLRITFGWFFRICIQNLQRIFFLGKILVRTAIPDYDIIFISFPLSKPIAAIARTPSYYRKLRMNVRKYDNWIFDVFTSFQSYLSFVLVFLMLS